MFWKIIFGLYAIFLFVFGLQAGLEQHSNSIFSTPMALAIWGVMIFIYCVFALFYTNAFKLKTCSKTLINISLTATIIANIFVPLWAIFAAIEPDKLYSSPFVSVILYIILLIILFVCFIPLYIGFFCYHKNYEQFNNLDKSFITIFAGFELIAMTFPYLCASIWELISHSYTGLLSYNIVSLLCYIYSSIFLAGVALKKRILPKKFWTISAIPFVLVYELYPENWNKLDYLEPFRGQSWLLILLYLVWTGIFYYMLYRYAFTKDYDNEQI